MESSIKLKGTDIEVNIPDPPTELCCMICLLPCFPDPRETDCCGELICLGCYNDLRDKNKCPLKCHKPFGISKISKKFIKVIKSIKKKCPKCKQITNYGDFAEH